MEFLVHIEIALPDLAPDAEQALRDAELARGSELQAEGSLRRVWRVPGRRANWSLYDVSDASALHRALTSLPLWPWMDIEVHPLAEHPADTHSPARLAGPIGRDSLDDVPQPGQNDR